MIDKVIYRVVMILWWIFYKFDKFANIEVR